MQLGSQTLDVIGVPNSQARLVHCGENRRLLTTLQTLFFGLQQGWPTFQDSTIYINVMEIY